MNIVSIRIPIRVKYGSVNIEEEHSLWRDTNFSNKNGFFPVFHDFKSLLPSLTGGAVSLFIYLGLHSNNQTGECFHYIDEISEFFKKSPRTISRWIDELEEANFNTKILL